MKMEKENKVKLVRIVLSAVLLAAAWALERCTALPMWQLLLVYMVPYLVAGYDVLLESGENIAHGEVFDEDFLMAVATMGAHWFPARGREPVSRGSVCDDILPGG